VFFLAAGIGLRVRAVVVSVKSSISRVGLTVASFVAWSLAGA
jgi:hypothetical protein